MPRYSAEQIYAFARQAGFSPDQAATMTAVALAESGGDSRAHNPVGEDSRGLWQVNARAHPDLAQRFDLYDPVGNARAAFQVSRHGTDFSPWTTTHHGASARYLRFQEEAQAAAVAHGDGAGRGVWTGTTGYGDQRSAGPDGGQPAAAPDGDGGQPAVTPVAAGTSATGDGPAQQAATTDRQGAEYGIPLEHGDPTTGRAYGLPLETSGAGSGEQGAGAPGQPGGPAADQPGGPSADQPGGPAAHTAVPAQAGGDKLNRFVEAALAQNGDRYIYGAEARLDAPDPSAFDCSELVEWAAHQAGLSITDGALAQYRQLHDAGTTMSVEEAIHTRGALLFSFSSDPVTGRPTGQHVAISLGDGHTIEAHNTASGVGIFQASTRRFNYAAMIPGTGAGSPPAADHPPDPVAPASATAQEDGHQFSGGPEAGEIDAFASRLAVDPDQLDHDTLPASLEFTGPTAPILPAQADPQPAAQPYEAEWEGHAAAHDAHGDGAGDGIHASVISVDLGAQHGVHHGVDADHGHDAAHGGH